MKARSLVGKRIVAVNQQRCVTNDRVCWQIRSIDLDDGTSILFTAHETEYEPVVSATHWTPIRDENRETGAERADRIRREQEAKQ